MMINKEDKILVWHCRGAASKAFNRYSKYYIDLYKPYVYVVLESRCGPNKIHKSLKLLGSNEYLVMENNDFAGDIRVAWKKEQLTISLCEKGVRERCGYASIP